MINPIDKDKTAEHPGLLPYPHTLGSVVVKPHDVGKIKSRALAAMHEQTNRQLNQIMKQAELLARQANEIKRVQLLSEKIYEARIPFEPFAGHVYHLYSKNGEYTMMMIGPEEWGSKTNNKSDFIASVKLLSDHTWEILGPGNMF